MKKNDDTKKNLSRRDFVKTTAVGIGGIGASALAGIDAAAAQAAEVPKRWDKTADVVVVGAGAAGLPAAIEAAEQGASVIVIEQNYDIGGHAIQSGGGMPLGGGTSLQKKYGIEDSPNRYFSDLVHWHDYRFSDREIVRVFADWSAPTFEWLQEHGQVIPGLYCAGESASGFNQHGLAKCIIEGRVAGRDAALSKTNSTTTR